jgi:hypothetical protein
MMAMRRESQVVVVRTAGVVAAVSWVKGLGGVKITVFMLAYLITPWSRVLLEKLTGFHLVKKFSEFYGTLRFITTFFHFKLFYLGRQFTYIHDTLNFLRRSHKMHSIVLRLGVRCGFKAFISSIRYVGPSPSICFTSVGVFAHVLVTVYPLAFEVYISSVIIRR